jgi:uncharacterized PurR-regulated membrane protein YhhQ (DUF165 family)
MPTTSQDDRWLLPRRQTEYPARGLLPEATLHRRREVTFLVLAAVFLVTTATLILLGTGRAVDLAALLARVAPSLEPRRALLVPLGVIPFAASFAAAALACELFGARRTSVLVWVGLFAGAGLAALLRIADVLDGGYAFGVAVALLACYAVAHASQLVVFTAMRRRAPGRARFLRIVFAGVVAQPLGWVAFALVLRLGRDYLYIPIAHDTLLALVVGSALSSVGCIVVLAVPAALVARGLALALRVGRDLLFSDEESAWPGASGEPASRRSPSPLADGSVARRLPPALILDDAEAAPARRTRAPSLQPFSSAEMRFFNEGDAAAE